MISILLLATIAAAFGDSTPLTKGNKIVKGEVYKAVCFETMEACDQFQEKLDYLMSSQGGFSKDGSTLVAAGSCGELPSTDTRPECENAEAVYNVRFTSTQRTK